MSRSRPSAPTSVAISVIVPVLEEGAEIATRLAALRAFRERGIELIVVDGGSTDSTVEQSRPWADQVLAAPRGRAAQMNAGAAASHGDVLLFLHADTALPDGADHVVLAALQANPQAVWGRFDVRIDSRRPLLQVVAWMMNLRSRITGMATGDQAIFVCRKTFEHVGGYEDLALMEDIRLSAVLNKISRPLALHERVVTSARRWETHGVWHTVFLMWSLRLAFFFGSDPDRLALRYGYRPRRS